MDRRDHDSVRRFADVNLLAMPATRQSDNTKEQLA